MLTALDYQNDESRLRQSPCMIQIYGESVPRSNYGEFATLKPDFERIGTLTAIYLWARITSAGPGKWLMRSLPYWPQQLKYHVELRAPTARHKLVRECANGLDIILHLSEQRCLRSSRRWTNKSYK